MSIKKRIIVSSIILLSLFFTLGVVNWIGNKSVMRQAENSYFYKDSTMHLQGIFRGINEFIIDEGEPLSVELIEEHLTGFEETFRILTTRIDDQELNKIMIEDVSPQWQRVNNGTKAFVKDNPWISADDDKAMLQYGKLIAKAKKLHKLVETLSEQSQNLSNTRARRTQHAVNIVAFTILLIISILLFNLFRSINSPIKELKHVARAFSRGDFSISMNELRKNEFGSVAADFNTASRKLTDMILNIKEMIYILASNSDKISSSAVQIASYAREQSSQTERTVEALEELNASFKGVAQTTNDASESAQDAVDLSRLSVDIIQKTVSGMNKIADSVKESTINIEALDNSSKQINEVINVINDIADQTNLLALNAAIEAARAGEQGRGFAVVADEVKKLAEKTSVSTKEISPMIKSIQENTLQTVESLHAWREQVAANLKSANEAGNAQDRIVSSIDTITEISLQIAALTDEQSRTGEIIITNVDSIAQLAKQAAEKAQHSSHATNDLNALMHKLQNIVSEFILNSESRRENTYAHRDNNGSKQTMPFSMENFAVQPEEFKKKQADQ
jgi:methyl-accepting chemotaxis protein